LVFPELWPVDERRPECFSTIATWENKGKNIEFGGASYVWSKHVNFLRFLEVPKRSHQCFTMAMLPPDAAVEAEVTRQGWRLTDPRPVSAGMTAYGDFIRGSRGEFTVAKDIYQAERRLVPATARVLSGFRPPDHYDAPASANSIQSAPGFRVLDNGRHPCRARHHQWRLSKHGAASALGRLAEYFAVTVVSRLLLEAGL
jgi:hypothetical protein